MEFGTLAAESGWNGLALQSVFCRGLNDQVQDALVAGVCPRDFDELVNRAVELDNYQHKLSCACRAEPLRRMERA